MRGKRYCSASLWSWPLELIHRILEPAVIASFRAESVSSVLPEELDIMARVFEPAKPGMEYPRLTTSGTRRELPEEGPYEITADRRTAQTADHHVVDGAPVARQADRSADLNRLLELHVETPDDIQHALFVNLAHLNQIIQHFTHRCTPSV